MENNTTSNEKKKPMTHEERLALAAKLDKELDDFIAGLEKKRYTEGWPEDRWQEEMEKHPFFMTKFPENGEVHPLLEGMQQLKYDENENTPEELANSYKEDGNFNFKYKKYRMAIISYTEGIKKKCGNPEIEAQLYSNRAAAHFHLGNFRSSLADSRQALKFKPNYHKAKLRAAQCCAQLKNFEETKKLCEEILESQPEEKTVLKILSDLSINEKIQNRNNRKQKLEEKKVQLKLFNLKTAIENRGIQLEVDGNLMESLEFSTEKPTLENGELSWPVFFLYPEYSMSDFIEQFHENSTFLDHLLEMFADPPHWDAFRQYKPDKLSIYYEGSDRTKLYSVDVHKTLNNVLSSRTFLVRDWKPSFIVLVKGSSTESNFLRTYTLVR